MKEITVGKNDAGRRLDRFLLKSVPGLTSSLLHKYARQGKIKRNGRRTKPEERILEGDVLALYLPDELEGEHTRDLSFLRSSPDTLRIVYEDENLLLLDKPQGLLCHSGETAGEDTLIDRVKHYLFRKGEFRPEEENAFSPALTNRIDRNTGGIVICAKNLAAMREMNEIIKERQIEKYYLCIVSGIPSPPEGELFHFLRRDKKQKLVRVYAHPVPDGRSARLFYRTLGTQGGRALLEVRLITGRTHQIRAQMAAAGYPLYGDGKYGVLEKGGKGPRHQALWAYRVSFPDPLPKGILSYLAGKSFRVAEVPFASGFKGVKAAPEK